MPTYILFGVVHPQRAVLEFSRVGMEFSHPPARLNGTATISIHKNQIVVSVVTAEPTTDFYTLRNVIGAFISILTDCAALRSVVAYEVELISVHDVAANSTLVFGADVPGLSIGANELRSLDLNPPFIVASKLPLFANAIGDFRQAIRQAGQTGFLCYRAVESLLHNIGEVESIGDKKQAIQKLEEILNVDSVCIERLRSLGGPGRHGLPVWIAGEERLLALRITRDILERFAAYYDPTVQTARPSFPKLTIQSER